MHPAQSRGSQTPTNSPWTSEGRREVLVQVTRGLQVHSADFPKREMRVGVCAGPCVLPQGWDTHRDLPDSCHWGQTCSFSSGQKKGHSHPPLPGCSSQALLGGPPSTLHSKVCLLTTHSVRRILQTRKLRLEMELGQGRI